MHTRFRDVRVTGVMAVVPRNVVRFDDEVDNYSQSPAKARKLKALMGYDERRIAPEGVCTSDLVAAGFDELVAQGKLDPADIDALVFVSQTPDYQIPPTSSVLHGRLGLREDAYCVDINQGCTGYITGLVQALMLLQVDGVNRVLLCAGDVLSAKTSPRDRTFYPQVGDAASLTILDRSPGAAPIDAGMGNRGIDHQMIMIPAGGARTPSTEATRTIETDDDGNARSQEQFVMQGGGVFTFSQTTVPDFVEHFIDQAGAKKDELDYYFFHQANNFMVKKLSERLDLPRNKVPFEIVSKYGNSSSATIPVTICSSLGEWDGSPIRVLLCGFGVGLAWGGVLLDLKNLDFCSMIEA